MSTFDPHQPVLITSDGTVTPITPENGKSFNLKEMQAYVGGYAQVMQMPHSCREINRIMILNEEGRLHGLPKNVVASAAFGPTGHIVGDVVICPSRLVR